MNYLKLKENIEKAIHAHPMEVEPYNDFFDLCREYEKIDFAVAEFQIIPVNYKIIINRIITIFQVI